MYWLLVVTEALLRVTTLMPVDILASRGLDIGPAWPVTRAQGCRTVRREGEGCRGGRRGGRQRFRCGDQTDVEVSERVAAPLLDVFRRGTCVIADQQMRRSESCESPRRS